MSTDSEVSRALWQAVEAILRPLCRLLLRHSVSFDAFEELAKRVFVHVAHKEFQIPGKSPSASRVAVLSGLTRKEVHRVLVEPSDVSRESFERYNRAIRVLTGWARDKNFRDAKGKPRLLDVEGNSGFGDLVKRYSGDMPVRSVLDELIHSGSVKQRDDGRLQLVSAGYVPHHSVIDKFGMLGRDVAHLIETIDHNLKHGATDARFQRKVMYQGIPVSALPAFRTLSSRQSQALLAKLDTWLAEHDTRSEEDGERIPVGLGVYYFEERQGARAEVRP